ncbi:ATP-binding protein [Tunicatimonas pelagia]|uniref:ATP-binding protein n=1 Tax=Tunicatimonas pelagia TaxID=931531 RepID=UPI002666DAD3|nr:ATP-binding protein [Tunicatimonas pelagia]WKN43104.1 ATP-binding protein [Tunicatimonas pelagia]
MATKSSARPSQAELEQAIAGCASEPIHIPGYIQPHGYLIEYDRKEETIRAVSENIEEFLGIATKELLSKNLSLLFEEINIALILKKIEQVERQDHPSYFLFHRPLNIAFRQMPEIEFEVSVHTLPDTALLELVPRTKQSELDFFEFNELTQDTLYWLNKIGTTPDENIFGICAREIKKITGFGRVMIYRFDSDYNGQVIAEDCGAMDSFLGLHFPSTDIPPQARELYLKNWFRIISDIDYQPVAIAQKKVEANPIDLSYSLLRSVSPVHVQYLKNMGVQASMSISIIVNQKLWGLIACHHHVPCYVSSARRTAAIYLGQYLSLHISRQEKGLIKERKFEAKSFQNLLLTNVTSDLSTFYRVVEEHENRILKLVEADGMMLILQDKVTVSNGLVVDAVHISDFVEWLNGATKNTLYYATDQLQNEYGKAERFQNSIYGVLAIPLLGYQNSYVIWFKKELLALVHWGGSKEKAIGVNKQGQLTLTPRTSFATFQETVQGISSPWEEIDIEIALEFAQSLALLQIKYLQEVREDRDQLRALNVQRAFHLKESLIQEQLVTQRLHAVLESSSDAIVALDSDLSIIVLNNNYQKLFQNRYGKVPQIGDSLLSSSKEAKEKKRLLNICKLAFKSEKRQEFFDDYHDLTGNLVYTQTTVDMLYDHQEEAIGTLVNIRDITKMKTAELEIKQLFAKYRLVVKSVSSLVWTTNPQGEFDTIQKGWCEYTGQELEQYSGLGWLNAIHVEDRSELNTLWKEGVDQQEECEFEARIWNQATKEHHFAKVFAIPIRNRTNAIDEWFCCCLDMQATKEREMSLEKALIELEASNLELERFAYVASHDLQEPLRMISSYLELIERRYRNILDIKGISFMNYAIDGANRMKRLIQDILAYSRLSKYEDITEVDITSIIHQVCEQQMMRIEEKNAVIQTANLPVVRGVSFQIIQLFSNLISNALKFSVADRQPIISIKAVEQESHWKFSVEDNGVGIPKKHQEKIFELFFRAHADPKYQGTGIGLPICKRVVVNHGGTITIQSKVNTGTTLIFTLLKTPTL